MADLDQSLPNAPSQLPQSTQSTENQPINADDGLIGSTRKSPSPDRERSRERQGDSAIPQASAPSRGGTLKKRRSLSRKGSLKRDGSRKRASYAGLDGQEEAVANADSEMNSAFYTPVTTRGSPTEILANRFQGK